MGMEKLRAFSLCLLVLGLGTVALGQAEITDFPGGLTEMVWNLRGVGPAQELRLQVEGLADGKYRVTMSLSLEGTGTELSALGFFGAPLWIQAAGTQLDLSTLNVLIRRREVLNVGESYALPGGEFFVREKKEIAGVPCLVGEFRPAEKTETVIELGLSLADPVYLFPLLRVQERGRVTFEIVLVEYHRP